MISEENIIDKFIKINSEVDSIVGDSIKAGVISFLILSNTPGEFRLDLLNMFMVLIMIIIFQVIAPDMEQFIKEIVKNPLLLFKYAISGIILIAATYFYGSYGIGVTMLYCVVLLLYHKLKNKKSDIEDSLLFGLKTTLKILIITMMSLLIILIVILWVYGNYTVASTLSNNPKQFSSDLLNLKIATIVIAIYGIINILLSTFLSDNNKYKYVRERFSLSSTHCLSTKFQHG